jgi:hypothetical protein
MFYSDAAGVAAPRLGPALALAPADLSWFFSVSSFGLMLGAALPNVIAMVTESVAPARRRRD